MYLFTYLLHKNMNKYARYIIFNVYVPLNVLLENNTNECIAPDG